MAPLAGRQLDRAVIVTLTAGLPDDWCSLLDRRRKMIRFPRAPNLTLLIVVIVIGLLLVYLPSAVVRQHEAAQALGPM